MRIQHNIPAMSSYRNYTNNTSALAKNLEKLSSGYKINRAGDDAAGLAISEKMRAQITGLEVAQKNAKDGISLVQTAEGALTEVHDMLNRMVTLAEQSANGTYDNDVDRYQLEKEMDQLKEEINRIADGSNFNGIKLLDGSLGVGKAVSSWAVEEDLLVSETPYAAGINVASADATGSKGTYSITIDKLFGSGDSVTLTFGSGDSANNPVTGALSGGVNIAFGTTGITGKTTAEQAESLKTALMGVSDVAAQFDIDVDENVVTLTAKNEGNKEITITEVKASSVTTSAVTTAGPTGATDTSTTTGWAIEDFLGTSSIEIESGGSVEVIFKDAQGNDWKAKVDVKASDLGASDADTWNNILNAIKDAKFEDNGDTLIDESAFTVGEIFTTFEPDATTTSILNIRVGSGSNDFFDQSSATVEFKTYKADGTALGSLSADASTGTASSTAASFSFGVDTSAGDADFSVGDKLTIDGALADGRTFTIELEAGKDFEIGTASTDTADNIVAALISNNVTVTLSDGTTATGDQLFSGSTDKDINVTSNSGKIKFASNVAATEWSRVTDAQVTPADPGAVSSNLVQGVQQTAAKTTISFDSGNVVQPGATLTVEGKNYEIVTDAANAHSGNTAIVVSENDFASGTALAQAVKNQLDTDFGTTSGFQITLKGNTVTLASDVVGSSSTAPSADATGGTQSAVSFTLDRTKMRNGSTVTLNGTTYEFVTDAANVATDPNTGNPVNVAVVMNTMNNDRLTNYDLGKALADKIAETDTSVSVEVNSDGLVTVKDANGAMVDGKLTFQTPTVEFMRKGGLTLQIGDTSESFNQLNVVVNDAHTWAIGMTKSDGTFVSLNDISIANQADAQEAMDVIKGAINMVSDIRGTLGATQNRLDHTINNLSVMQQNIQDAESTIRDVDIAAEMMAYTKNNILVQSAQAMLAQANQLPQGVLQLLQ